MVESLVPLHNFCINEGESDITTIEGNNYMNLQRNTTIPDGLVGKDACVATIDESGRPVDLLHHGHHFADAEHYRHSRTLVNKLTPMDKMIKQVASQKLKRPQY